MGHLIQRMTPITVMETCAGFLGTSVALATVLLGFGRGQLPGHDLTM